MALPLTLIDTGPSGDTLLEGMTKVNAAIDQINSGFFQDASNMISGILPEARLGTVNFSKVFGTASNLLAIDCDSASSQLTLQSNSTTATHKLGISFTNQSSTQAVIGLALTTTSYAGAGVGDLVIATISSASGNTNAIRFCTPSDDGSNYLTRLLIAKDGTMTYTGPSLSFGSSARQMINLYAQSYGIGTQNSTLYFRSSSHFSFHIGGTHSNNARDPGAGGTEVLCINSNGLHLGTSDSNTTAWYRSFGTTGWYNNTYAGGIYMTDSIFIRTYNSKTLRIDKNWDNYGNLYIAGDAPSIVMYDTDNARKWLFHCNSDALYFYRCNTSGEAATDWTQKVIFSSDGNIWSAALGNWLTAYLNQALLTTSNPTFGRVISGHTQTPNFLVNDSSSCFEVRTADASGCANITFYRPGAFAAKFGINTSNQFEWGGSSMYPGRMLLDGSGNLTITGRLTADNITLTGGTMSAVKSVRRYSLASSVTSGEVTIPIGVTVDPNKTVIIATTATTHTGYSHQQYVYLYDANNIRARNYISVGNTTYTLFWQLIEYY